MIILAATNQPEVLDAALRRPGRFDRTVTVSSPALVGRQQVLGVHARLTGVRLRSGTDLGCASLITPFLAQRGPSARIRPPFDSSIC